MPKKKKETPIKPIIQGPTFKDIDDLWNVIEELQKNLQFVNDKIKTISNRLGV